MKAQIPLPDSAITSLRRLAGLKIRSVEVAVDNTRTATDGTIALAVYVWTELGLVRIHGDSYRGFQRHDFPTLVAKDVPLESLADEDEFRAMAAPLAGAAGLIKAIVEIWRSDPYAGTAGFLTRGLPVEFVVGLLFVLDSGPIVILASDYEPSLEVFTAADQVTKALGGAARLVAIW